MLTFLTALFDKVAEVVEEIYAESHVRSHEDLARLFRLRMTDGQSAQRCNEYRTRFYGDVVRRATTVKRLFLLRLLSSISIIVGHICQR